MSGAERPRSVMCRLRLIRIRNGSCAFPLSEDERSSAGNTRTVPSYLIHRPRLVLSILNCNINCFIPPLIVRSLHQYRSLFSNERYTVYRFYPKRI